LQTAQHELAEAQMQEAAMKEALLKTLDTIEQASRNEEKAAKLAEELRVLGGRLSARERLLEELERSYEGYGGGVRFLMNRNMKGIIGVLGELLQVPAGWELAIETVLGAKMQDIVCQNDAAAKAAIEQLKKNQAGRLTFLPVDDLRVQRLPSAEAVKGCPGFLGLAAEQVSIRGGYQHIVDYLLGKVVICDDLDHALAMSSRSDSGLRFVTLEGEIVSAAGAITGGSFKHNTANILTRKAEREKLQKQLLQNEQQLQQITDEKAAAAGALAQAAKEREKAAEALSRMQTEKALKESSLQLLESRLKEEEGESHQRGEELTALQKEILVTGEEQAKALQKLQTCEQTMETDRDALEKNAEQLAELQQRFDTHREAMAALRLQEASAAQKRKGLAYRLDDMKQAAAELTAEIGAKQQLLEKNSLLRRQTDAFTESAGEVLDRLQIHKKELEQSVAALEESRRTLEQKRLTGEEERRSAESALYDKQMLKHEAELRLARCEAHTDSFKDKLYDEFSMTYAQAYELADPQFVLSKGIRESREFKDRMRSIGNVNIGAIEEYKAVRQRYDFLTGQRSDLLQAISQLNTVIEDTDQLIRDMFKKSFDSVVENFETTFKELFNGGNARLSLADPDNPMESAIEIEAQPPGKKLQNINLLSGGEKTMTAIALMFAVLRSKPTPFCILDEVEAALDENNIRCFASYLKKFSKTQFALVTHQRATMEHADVMYGVTMAEHGVSKMLSLKLGDQIAL
ncbi:MAG: AAA family ATPase, partial [Firmicutes bacterium]|nr:AAA family ATPase [Bacillota bacterium]